MVAQTPPAIIQIAQRVQSQERGAVVFRLRRIFDVHAGPMHRHDEMELGIASDGPRVVKVRVIRALTGGKAADARGIAQLEQQYEHPAPLDVFHRPFDVQYTGEYAYEAVDAHTYRFKGELRDGSHGDGTFSLDDAGNVIKYQYTPAVMPRYANSGTVIDERSQVLPNFWAVTGETQQYSGHYAIFGGGATVSIQYDSFRRYPDVNAAVAALDAACGPTPQLCRDFPPMPAAAEEHGHLLKLER
jgi:hypothetical protein